ncbi:hypothetical protein BLOT_008212 [Blomia tropicalis]|nr:hypothetical protein BLOT_008212 [Blomia tropicalis]
MNYFSITNLFISTIFVVFCWNEAVSEKSVQANVDECDFYDTSVTPTVNPLNYHAIGKSIQFRDSNDTSSSKPHIYFFTVI